MDGDTGLQDKVEVLNELCADMGSKACAKGTTLEIIAHGAGSYRHYAMDFDSGIPEGNSWDLEWANAINATDLINATFETGKVDSIEIDAQVPPENHPFCIEQESKKLGCSFIMHNSREKDGWGKLTASHTPDAYRYMQQNTTYSVIQDFIKVGHHQDKHIYLELKNKLGCMDSTQSSISNSPSKKECMKDGERVATEIKDIILANPTKKGQRNWLTVVSFSAASLEGFRSALQNDLKDAVDYGLIAGYDMSGFWGYVGLKDYFAQSKGDVPRFDSNMQSFAINTQWLDRVWFSAKGLGEPAKFMNSIKQQRLNKYGKQDPLSFSISTYDVYHCTLEDALLNDEHSFIGPLNSMMIDIDNFPL
jgi:hypothetical protein